MEHITYLMELLNLQKSMIYNILKGEGFDTISRSRQLAAALKIHPPLLGIDAKFYPIELHAYWWRAYGFSFHTDAQGYPLMSEVTAYFRQQRTLTEYRGRVKVWSQEDLGDATGLKKETIFRVEHEKNPLVLESMSRRAIVAAALGNLAGENEPTIFRLYGLDPQAYGVPVPAQECLPILHLSTKKLTDEMLQERQETQKAFFKKYYTDHAQDRVGELLEQLSESQALLSLANTTAHRVGLLALASRYHRLLACVAREQCQKSSILLHTSKAVKLAEQAMTLPNPKLGSDQAHLLTTHELLASALFTTVIRSKNTRLMKHIFVFFNITQTSCHSPNYLLHYLHNKTVHSHASLAMPHHRRDRALRRSKAHSNDPCRSGELASPVLAPLPFFHSKLSIVTQIIIIHHLIPTNQEVKLQK